MHSGWERCVGYLPLCRSGATAVFLSLTHHISPTWWMYVTCGRRNDLSSGDRCWNGVGVGFANPEVLCSLETNLWPCGSESKSFISSHCGYARLEGWGGVGWGVSGAGAAVCSPLLWLGFVPHTCIYSRGLSRKLQGSKEKVDGRNPT